MKTEALSIFILVEEKKINESTVIERLLDYNKEDIINKTKEKVEKEEGITFKPELFENEYLRNINGTFLERNEQWLFDRNNFIEQENEKQSGMPYEISNLENYPGFLGKDGSILAKNIYDQVKDLEIDYLFSNFGNIGSARIVEHIRERVNYFDTLPGENLSSRIRYYLKRI